MNREPGVVADRSRFSKRATVRWEEAKRDFDIDEKFFDEYKK